MKGLFGFHEFPFSRPSLPGLTAAFLLYGCIGNLGAQEGDTAPVIQLQPQNQTNLVCSTATFRVVASGTAPLSYQWTFNGNLLADGTGSSYVICDLQPSHEGIYAVTVANLAGSTHAAAFLEVLEGEDLQFADEQVKAAVRASLGLSGPDCPVTAVAMQRLTNLWAGGFEITNISDLTNAPNLKEAYLARNRISDLSPLAELRRLERLTLLENDITDVGPLTNVSSLTDLDLSRNPVRDASALGSLTNLKHLALNSTSITNLDFAASLLNLESFCAYETGLTDVSPLTNLSGLSSLDLRWNALTNAETLSSLKSLRTLHLGATGVTNFDFLEGLNELTLLNLAENRIRDFPSLRDLTNLSYLVLSSNPIQDYAPIAEMRSLANLELRGNGLTDNEIGWLSGLTNLRYIDLARNNLTNVSSLSCLTNLALVLDENSGLDYSALSSLTNISMLWLNGNAITNLGFLRDMRQLVALGIDAAKADDLSPLKDLGELRHLSVCRSAATNYQDINSLSNLQSLRLEGNLLLTNAPEWGNLKELQFLSLNDNRFTDTAELTNLTQLRSLYLRQNRLVDAHTLTNLRHLAFVDMGRNLLDLGAFPAVKEEIRQLRHNRAELNYQPTNEPPRISLNVALAPKWYIPVNETSDLRFQVCDDLIEPEEFRFDATSFPANCVSNSPNFKPPLPVTPTNAAKFVLTVTAAEPGALSVSTNVEVHAMIPADVILEPNLSNVVAQAAYAPHSPITTVDLLNIAQLFAYNAAVSDLSGLEYASNLTTLYFRGNTITNVAPLEHLTALTSLSFYDNSIEDVSALDGLTNLTYLDLSRNPITNHTVIGGLTNLSLLHLEHANLSDLQFLSNLTQLTSLTISDNKLTDLAQVAMLTNLTSLYVQQNRLRQIDDLTNLTQLQVLDVRWNLLDSNSTPVLNVLAQNGCRVSAEPQREPPSIDIRTNWLVGIGTISALPFAIIDSGPADEPISVNAEVFPSELEAGLERTDGPLDFRSWQLWLTNPPPTQSPSEILISATNDVGLSSTKRLYVTSADLIPADGEVLDLNLAWKTNGNAGWFGQTLTFLSLPGQTNTSSAQSGAVGNGQNSILQTIVTGPGKISFWWKVSSETNADFLEFTVTNYTTAISGEVDWQEKKVRVGAGEQVLTWRYAKDSAISSGMDAGWVDRVHFEPGEFPPHITSPPADQIVSMGSDATFTVVAELEPLTYQWYFNLTNLLPGAVGRVLTLPAVSDADAGGYSVVIESGLSVTSSVAQLTVNHLPVPAVPALDHFRYHGIKARAAAFLLMDPDGDALSLNSAGPGSAAGGTVDVAGDWVFYTPSDADPDTDSFPFSVSDSRGGVSEGTAVVNVIPKRTLALTPHFLNDGRVKLVFDGVPLRYYFIQSATNLVDGDWQTFGLSQANSMGVVLFSHTPASPDLHYRAIEP